MTKEQVISYLSETLSDILDRPITLTEATRPEDVEGWDSLTMMTFMVLIENDLHVQMSIEEITRFESIGALAERILNK